MLRGTEKPFFDRGVDLRNLDLFGQSIMHVATWPDLEDVSSNRRDRRKTESDSSHGGELSFPKRWMLAAWLQRRLELIDRFVDLGVDINSQRGRDPRITTEVEPCMDEGDTPLACAVRTLEPSKLVVRKLMLYGADPHIANASGM